MDVEALLAAYDAEVRPGEWKNLPAGVHAETDGPVVRVLGFSRGFISPPPVLELESEELSSLISRQREVFAARGEAVEWKARGHDLPKDIVTRLLAEGFLPEDPETVLIGDAAEMARQDAPLPPDVAIRQTSSDADLRRIGEMESEVWVDAQGWDADDLIRNVQTNPDQVAVFIAEAGGRVVAAGWLEHAPGSRFAGLWGGSTLELWRHRGIYRTLVARRAVLAVQRGATYLQVDASENSRPILERLGFVAMTSTTPYVWRPDEARREVLSSSSPEGEDWRRRSGNRR